MVNLRWQHIFSDVGYNFLPSEICAGFCFGAAKKIEAQYKKRIYNFDKLKNFSNYPNLFELPRQQKN